MAAKLGKAAKLYYKVGGCASSTGTWTELTKFRNVTLPLRKGEADVTNRGSGGWKQKIAGLKEAPINGELVWDTSNAGFAALLDAFLNDDVIGLAILDGAKATATGLAGDFQISEFTRNEPLEEAITANFTAWLTDSTVTPVWIDEGTPALETVGA